MGKADRMTAEELEYIRSVYPELGPTEISRRLGRSLSAVKARIKEMGLKKEARRAIIPTVEVELIEEPKDTYDRLIEAREVLRKNMVNASPSCIASICKEYRAVLQEIEALESGNNQKEDNPLEKIAKAIANGSM